MLSILKFWHIKGYFVFLLILTSCFFVPSTSSANNRLCLGNKQYVIGLRHYYVKMNETKFQDVCIKPTFCDSAEYFADLAAVVKNYKSEGAILEKHDEHDCNEVVQ